MSSPPLPGTIELAAAVWLEVPFHDADPAGVAWHGNYFRYFDAARSALLEQLGYGYRRMAEDGLYWPIVQASVKYIRPVPYGTRVLVTARLAEWEYRLKIAYDVAAEDGQRTTTGFTVQVPVSAATGAMDLAALATLHERLASWRDGPGRGA
jgi:acyl-CoA thioester hydrolase